MLPAFAYLHAHGVDVQPDALDRALAEALAQHRAVLYPSGGSGLTEAETEVLRAGGLDPTPRDLGSAGPLVRGVAEHAAILKSALTTAQVAERLGVTEARVRQRLQKRSLFGVETRHGWRIPSFQFTESGELPGWSTVAPRLPADLTAVELFGWLSEPNPDLFLGEDDEPVTPRAWLLAGRSARAVAELAADLA